MKSIGYGLLNILFLGLFWGGVQADQPLSYPNAQSPWWRVMVPANWQSERGEDQRVTIRSPENRITVTLWSRQQADDDRALNELVAETEIILGHELEPEMTVQPDGFRPFMLNSLRGIRFWARGVGTKDQRLRDMDFVVLRLGQQRWLFLHIDAQIEGGERYQPQLQQLLQSLRAQ